MDQDQGVVLEQRVGPGAAGGDGSDHVPERVGRAQHEAEEEGGHHVDHQGRPGHQLLPGPPAEPPDHGGGVAAENHPPQQDRPGQGRPQPGDGVEPRRVTAVVVGHVAEGEVVGEEGVLHGRHRDDPAQEDERGVDLAAAHGGGLVPPQADGQDGDADHGGGEAEEDADVAEGAVHRRRPGRGCRSVDPAVTAWSRSERSPGRDARRCRWTSASPGSGRRRRSGRGSGPRR